jgi:ABC-2 type transport system ATP-binding protein
MIDAPCLELEALTIRFKGGFQVGPVTHTFGPGIHWLRGHNGSGKTTVLEAIACIRRPSAGRVKIDSKDPWLKPLERAKVGYVSASASLPDHMTVSEAWRFAAAMRRCPDWRGAHLIEELGLRPGLMLGHASAGQRRRAELVAALAGDPAVLLLDEVFSYLDEAGATWLRSQLDALRERRVIIMTAHHELGLEHDTMYEFSRE